MKKGASIMNMKTFKRGQNRRGLSGLALMLLVLPLAASCGDDDDHTPSPPPPGAMSNGAYLRVELTTSAVKMCADANYARVLYKELKAGETRAQFCQCVNENFYAKFSDAELVQDRKEMSDNLDRLDTLTAAEKEAIRRKAEKNEQRLAESETYCMKKLNVSVTPAPRMKSQ
jgi:hypothetical protein